MVNTLFLLHALLLDSEAVMTRNLGVYWEQPRCITCRVWATTSRGRFRGRCSMPFGIDYGVVDSFIDISKLILRPRNVNLVIKAYYTHS